MNYRIRYPAVGILIFLVAVFFYPTYLFGKLPVPADTLVGLYHPWRDANTQEYPRGIPFKNFLITDPVRQQIPWRKSVIDAWKAGKGALRLWNPYAFGGAPLSGNIQAAPFYPLNVIFFLFPFPVAWTALIVLQPLMGAIGMYWYLRSLKRSRLAGMTGAVSWSFGGFGIAWLTWGTMMQTAMWLPFLLLFTDKLSVEKNRGQRMAWIVRLAVTGSMVVLAGHMQIAAYVLGLTMFYAWWRYRQIHAASRIHAVGLARAAASAGMIALLLTSVQWVPFLQTLGDAGRLVQYDSWKQPGWFLPAAHLVQFIAPDFFGNPATLNYWGQWNYGEFIGYMGIIPLVLALGAMSLRGIPGFFTVVSFMAVFFMLRHPITEFLYFLRIPVFSVLQPTRLMALADFSLAVLAAYGLDAFRHGTYKKITKAAGIVTGVVAVAWVVAAGVKTLVADPEISAQFAVALKNLILPTAVLGAGLALGVVYTRMRPRSRWVLMALYCIIVADVFRFGWKFTPFTPPDYFFPRTRMIDFLKQQPQPFRVMTTDDRILPPNVSAFYAIESVDGYDPVVSVRYQRFLGALETGRVADQLPAVYSRIYAVRNIDSVLLPYLNARYILSLADMDRPFLELQFREGETRGYYDSRSLPRVYLARDVHTEPDSNAVLGFMLENRDYGVAVTESDAGVLDMPLTSEEGVRLLSYTPNAIRFTSTTASPRLVVFLNRHDPGWRVSVNGTSARILRTNFLFMGVVVPAGTNTVEFTYH